MRILLSLLLLLVVLTPAFATEWVTRAVPGALICTHPGEDALAAELAGYVQSELPRVAGTLGVAHPGPYAVYAYTNRAEFLRATAPIPYLQGVSYQPTGVVRIDATAQTPVRQVLAHELTHSVLNQRLGTRIVDLPVWVNEGIAGYLADPLTPAQARGSARQIAPEQVLTVSELDTAFDHDATRAMAYQQSRAMVAWLDTRYPEALPQLLTAIAQGSTFTSALKRTTDLTPDDWLRRWQRDIPAFVYWLPFLASPAFYAPLALLTVIIAILRALKRRNEADEEEEDADKDEEEASSPSGETDEATAEGVIDKYT